MSSRMVSFPYEVADARGRGEEQHLVGLGCLVLGVGSMLRHPTSCPDPPAGGCRERDIGSLGEGMRRLQFRQKRELLMVIFSWHSLQRKRSFSFWFFRRVRQARQRRGNTVSSAMFMVLRVSVVRFILFWFYCGGVTSNE